MDDTNAFVCNNHRARLSSSETNAQIITARVDHECDACGDDGEIESDIESVATRGTRDADARFGVALEPNRRGFGDATML